MGAHGHGHALGSDELGAHEGVAWPHAHASKALAVRVRHLLPITIDVAHEQPRAHDMRQGGAERLERSLDEVESECSLGSGIGSTDSGTVDG